VRLADTLFPRQDPPQAWQGSGLRPHQLSHVSPPGDQSPLQHFLLQHFLLEDPSSQKTSVLSLSFGLTGDSSTLYQGFSILPAPPEDHLTFLQAFGLHPLVQAPSPRGYHLDIPLQSRALACTSLNNALPVTERVGFSQADPLLKHLGANPHADTGPTWSSSGVGGRGFFVLRCDRPTFKPSEQKRD